MSNAITVNVELGPESKALLNQLLEALTQKPSGCHCHSGTEAPATPQPASNEPPEVVDESSEPEVVDESSEPEVPTYTREDIQALVQTLAGPKSAENPYGGKRAATRAIVKKYAEKVGNIPEDKFAEVMEQLLELKEGQ